VWKWFVSLGNPKMIKLVKPTANRLRSPQWSARLTRRSIRNRSGLCRCVNEATNQMQRRSGMPFARQRDNDDCCALYR